MERRRWTTTRSTFAGSRSTTTRWSTRSQWTASALAASVLDERTTSLVRIAAIIAVDAAPASFQHAVTHALAAGATRDEIVATLEAVTPVAGAARVVASAPKLALALGYDVEAALEQFDP